MDLAEKMTIPKLKEYMKKMGVGALKSSAKKADYVKAAMEVSEKAGYEKAIEELISTVKAQGKGFN